MQDIAKEETKLLARKAKFLREVEEIMRKSKGVVSPQSRVTKDSNPLTSVDNGVCKKKRARNRSILGTAIRFLPNCKDFKIELKGIKSLAELFGLNLKEEPNIIIEP